MSEIFLLHRDNKCFLKWEHFHVVHFFCVMHLLLYSDWGLGRRYCLNWKQIITEWKSLCQRNRIIQNMRGKQKMTLLDIGKCVIKSYVMSVLFPYNEIQAYAKSNSMESSSFPPHNDKTQDYFIGPPFGTKLRRKKGYLCL